MAPRPDYTDPLAAARVSDFMEEAVIGRWRLKPFEVDEDYYHGSLLRALHEAGDDPERRAMAAARTVPPGEYVSLQRKATQVERDAKDWIDLANDGYVPVMSDTPAEIEEHSHALEHATGRVLIHGLGLGVLVSALIAKPDVTHIDVVEIDPDVMRLTGPYYMDHPKVQVHLGDAVEVARAWNPTEVWDYVWHDIWSQISDNNLDPETAEHGIAYSTLFDLFEHRAKLQGAWAYPEAKRMQASYEREIAEREEWEAEFWAADYERRVEMVWQQHVADQIRHADGRRVFKQGEVPQRYIDWFKANVPDLDKVIRKNLETFNREDWLKRRDETGPASRPNDEIVRETEVER